MEVTRDPQALHRRIQALLPKDRPQDWPPPQLGHVQVACRRGEARARRAVFQAPRLLGPRWLVGTAGFDGRTRRTRGSVRPTSTHRAQPRYLPCMDARHATRDIAQLFPNLMDIRDAALRDKVAAVWS